GRPWGGPGESRRSRWWVPPLRSRRWSGHVAEVQLRLGAALAGQEASHLGGALLVVSGALLRRQAGGVIDHLEHLAALLHRVGLVPAHAGSPAAARARRASSATSACTWAQTRVMAAASFGVIRPSAIDSETAWVIWPCALTTASSWPT